MFFFVDLVKATDEASGPKRFREGSISAETVEKPFTVVNGLFSGVSHDPCNYEIIVCGAFCEVIFFCISLKNLSRDFFDSLAMNVAFLHL